MGHYSSKPSTALAHRSKAGCRIQKPGVTKLCNDADEAVSENSKEIAKALVDKAKGGDANSARLLVDLAEGAESMERSGSVSEALSQAVKEWKTEPKSVQLEITTNPPKLKPPERLQLTDGHSQS